MKKILLTLVGLAVMTAGGYAQIISFEETGSGAAVTYPVNFKTSSISGVTLTAASNLDSAILSLGSGATAGTAGGSLGFANADDVATLASAITADLFQTITLDPSTGFQLNISGVTFNADASSGTSTFNFDLLSSVSGFTSSDSLGTISVVNGASVSTTIDLSGNSSFQGVTAPIEFRIYVNRSAGAGTAAYYADDGVNSGLFSVNGTVSAIPEPATWALLTLGGMALMIRRKLGAVKA